MNDKEVGVSLKEKIDKDKLPKHIAIIMDGNGRWAKSKGEQRAFGHEVGVKSVDEVVEAATEAGVKFLTMYTFSTENWNRPQAEVNAIMKLLVHTIHAKTEKLSKNGVRLLAIGDLNSLPGNCNEELQKSIDATKDNTRLTLVLALSYSSKWEIVEAVKQISNKVANNELKAEAISDDTITKHLSTANIPDPELMIRTGGEHRISNYLLWQLAYSELYFTDTLWPDFRKEEFYAAILDYQNRERRFGKTSEQVTS